MKSIVLMSSIFFLVSLAFGGSAFSGEYGQTAEGMLEKEGAAVSEALPDKDQFEGMSVLDQKGENIGKVSSLTVDDDGRIQFVTLSSGGIMGIGKKAHQVPFSAFRLNEEATALILTVDESLLTNAPTKKPDMTEEQFNSELYEHYGQAPYWEHEEMEAIPEVQEEMEAIPEGKEELEAVPEEKEQEF